MAEVGPQEDEQLGWAQTKLPVDGAGQQQVLVGAGTVDVGKLDRDAERIRQRLGQARGPGEAEDGGGCRAWLDQGNALPVRVVVVDDEPPR